jgi:hypothetical protein
VDLYRDSRHYSEWRLTGRGWIPCSDELQNIFEGSGRGLIQVLSRHLSGRNNTNNLCQNSRYRGRDSKQATSEYRCRALPLEIMMEFGMVPVTTLTSAQCLSSQQQLAPGTYLQLSPVLGLVFRPVTGTTQNETLADPPAALYIHVQLTSLPSQSFYRGPSSEKRRAGPIAATISASPGCEAWIPTLYSYLPARSDTRHTPDDIGSRAV